jgi:NAD(P)-dependent dehydrogenase (short-subunit alcohol dehydrogenase family)
MAFFLAAPGAMSGDVAADAEPRSPVRSCGSDYFTAGIRQLHNEQTRQAENIRRERTTHCAPRTGDLTTAVEGSKALLDYSMTKGGIHAFTKSLSAQLIDRGIRVNAVTPGAVWTPLCPADRPPEEMAKFRAAPRWAPRRSPRRSRPPSFSWRRRPARATSPARFCRSSTPMGEPQAEAARRHGHDADTPSPSRLIGFLANEWLPGPDSDQPVNSQEEHSNYVAVLPGLNRLRRGAHHSQQHCVAPALVSPPRT